MELILRSIVTCLFVTYALGVEFKYPDNNICIMAQINVSFTLSKEKEMLSLPEPQVDKAGSSCASNGSTSTLALKWNGFNDTMIFTFFLNTGKVEMRVEYKFIPSQHFKDSKDSNLTILNNPKDFELSMSNMSYKCDSSQNITLNGSMYQLVMSFAKVQIQAFGVEKDTFSNFKECSEDTLTTENPPPETTSHHSLTTTGPHPTSNPPEMFQSRYPEAGDACILLNAAIQVDIKYMDVNNATATAKIDIPSVLDGLKVTGQCDKKNKGTAFIMLHWNVQRSTFSVKMNFETDTEARVKTIEVMAMLLKENFPDLPDKSKNVTSVGNVVSFHSTKQTYYICNSSQEVTLDNTTMVVIDQIQVQAFGVNNSAFTGKGTECSQDLSTENPTTVTTPTHTPKNPTTATEETLGTMTTANETTSTSAPVSNSTMTTSNGTTATSAPISTTAVTPHPTNTYIVRDGNVTCVYFVARMDFTIPYTTKNKTNASVVISVPQKFEADGNCSTPNKTTNELNIYFFNNSWMLAFVFGPDNSSSQLGDMQFKTYSVKSISLEYKMDSTLFPGYNDSDDKTQHAEANITEPLFQSSVNGSYKCNADFAVPFNGSIKLETYNLQYKAFNQDNSTNFTGDLKECSADNSNDNNKTNSVVPIAVGAALAGLVVIVLIAYLIGRRRNRKGYESV